MKPIDKNELYEHLSNFFRSKGVELKNGSYSRRIEKGCHLFAEAINLGQTGLERAKVEFDRKLEEMRQVIHEKTAPKQTPEPPAAAAPPPVPPKTEPKSPKAAKPKPAPRRRKAPAKRAKH